MISTSFFVLSPELYNFPAFLKFCRGFWKQFQSKKSVQQYWSGGYQQVISHTQENQSRIQDILAEGSSSAPNAKVIHEKLNRMTQFEILDAVEQFPKFEEIVKTYFPPECERLNINEDKFDRLSSYMRIFGHLIKSINWSETCGEIIENPTRDEKYLKLIAKFCGKSLIGLAIKNQCLNFNANLLSQFQVLEELSIIGERALISDFGCIPSLKRLWLVRCKLQNFYWFSQNFPKLEHIYFVDVDCGLKDDMLIELQKHNPQLKTLVFKFSSTSSITSSVLKNIGTRTPNVEKLNCHFNGDVELEANTVHLSGLHKLEHLDIFNNFKLFSAKALIDSLASEQIPITYLYINGNDVMENLPKLKQLKTVVGVMCSEQALINSIKQMPALEDIHVIKLMAATVPGILQVLQSIQNVKLTLRIKELSIDPNEYSSMLALVKDRHLKVHLYIDDAYIDVEDDVLDSNSQWLEIKYD